MCLVDCDCGPAPYYTYFRGEAMHRIRQAGLKVAAKFGPDDELAILSPDDGSELGRLVRSDIDDETGERAYVGIDAAIEMAKRALNRQREQRTKESRLPENIMYDRLQEVLIHLVSSRDDFRIINLHTDPARGRVEGRLLDGRTFVVKALEGDGSNMTFHLSITERISTT